MVKRRSMACWFTVACCLLWLNGCGKSNRPETAKVSGTVTLDGKPLSIGTVVFTPETGRSATGAIQSDGTYCMGTYSTSDGAVLGLHHVSVVAREQPAADATRKGPMGNRPGKWLIPKYYSDYTLSGLSFEVKSDGWNVYNIQLSSTAKSPQEF